jgi:radical SAM superfamily enzyme YgiQ (UPF0313 family)
MLNVLLISTYEMGRQPFGLASPAAWLKQAGASVRCLDLSIDPLDDGTIRAADLVAFYAPMHMATRMAVPLIERVRRVNPQAHLCCYGLYAPVSAAYLRRLGVETILGGEFETGLVSLVERLNAFSTAGVKSRSEPFRVRRHSELGEARSASEDAPLPGLTRAENGTSKSRFGRQSAELPLQAGQPEPLIYLGRQEFLTPDRANLPPLHRYAHLVREGDQHLAVGYTEASRGCKHLCRHCPIVPVYEGHFRVVPREVVLADIRQQVAAGAQHITFGDPDFFNGPGHALPLAAALHQEFPQLTYDVTIKVEHLLKHAHHLPRLTETGCLFITSAVESFDQRVLAIFDKQHTREDFETVLSLCRDAGLLLAPTFVPFTPWTTLAGYRAFLADLVRLGLVDQVAPIQAAIRLLIPPGSKLLELPEVQDFIGELDETKLSYTWRSPDPRLDQLQQDLELLVQRCAGQGISRRETFRRIWTRAYQEVGDPAGRVPFPDLPPPGRFVPYLTEPWYC